MKTEQEKMIMALIAELETFDTANLCDGMQNPRVMHHDLKPLSREWKIAGPARTVALPVGDSLLTSLAIETAEAGEILVIDAKNSPENAVWGDMKSFAAKAKQIAGIVIDGAVRDPAGIREIGVPVFAKYVTCRASSKNNGGELNIPISCAGVIVAPGDIIVGDEGGVISIPRSSLEAVMRKTKEKIAAEEKTKQAILEGRFLSPKIRETLEKLGY